jgi:DNA-binding NtrC family response regulator
LCDFPAQAAWLQLKVFSCFAGRKERSAVLAGTQSPSSIDSFTGRYLVFDCSCKTTRFLAVSRDPAVLDVVRSVAAANAWQAEVAADIWDALERAYSGTTLSLLVLDLSTDPANCAQLSRILSRVRPQLALVLIGRSGDFEPSQQASRLGASDYVLRPVQACALESAIRRSLPAAIEPADAEVAALMDRKSGPAPPQGARPSTGNIRDRKSLRSLLRSVKEEAERNAIAEALEETGWNRKAAARLLKTSYRTVLYKIEQYQMTASKSALIPDGTAPEAGRIDSRNNAHDRIELGLNESQ